MYELKEGSEPTRGRVVIAENTEINVRRSAEVLVLNIDETAAEFKADFEDQGLLVSEPEIQEHAGREMRVLEIEIPPGLPAFNDVELLGTLYFFMASDLGMGQLQCIGPPENQGEMRASCDLALVTLRDK